MKEEPMRRVPRYDLVSPMQPCKAEILAGVDRILSTGAYILGEETRALEREMADACEAADSVGVASGSAALYLALQICGVGPGVEVITTPYTFVATLEAVIIFLPVAFSEGLSAQLFRTFAATVFFGEIPMALAMMRLTSAGV